ncbi:hypothetical protein RFI_32722 [Reticulomyxa filosa]|uniref:Uncharacterized protein n=1 Tax=Reticulomyxa filosa TaxID=46433 RepID=X6LU55_RETFI|nr:hypothetical protein RFI_32722 [Reticulomyxa filosa]|eukprot:ETO04677.1 hypothetical protein RFI_32722 [Reticulomyxa filosa]
MNTKIIHFIKIIRLGKKQKKGVRAKVQKTEPRKAKGTERMMNDIISYSKADNEIQLKEESKRATDGESKLVEELSDEISHNSIGYICGHDVCSSMGCYPNSIEWSGQNVLSVMHGPFISIIDINYLYKGKPLERTMLECKNDISLGLNGGLGHIHVIPSILSDCHLEKINTNDDNNNNNFESLSPLLFTQMKWCPNENNDNHRVFKNSGLICVLQSDYSIFVYGQIPLLWNTNLHMSTHCITPQFTSVAAINQCIQPR